MLLRFAIFVVLALGLGGFGTVAWLSVRHPAKPHPIAYAAPPPPPVKHIILSAAAYLHAGALIRPGDLASLAVAKLPDDGERDTPANRAGLVGAMVRHDLSRNEPLLAGDVLRSGDHGFLAAVLAPGTCAASVGVNAVSGNAGLIWPGDYVDLILTQDLGSIGAPANHRVAAETVLSGVRVIAIDQFLAHGTAPATDTAGTQRTVTLEVSAQQARDIAVATQLGRLSLAVRAVKQIVVSTRPAPITTVWAGDVSPALDQHKPPPSHGAVLRLYDGPAEGKELRF